MDWLENNSDFTDFNKRLNTVEGVLFDQGSKAENNFVPGLMTVVGKLEIKMDDFTQEIENIYERLTWQDIK